LKTVFLLFSSTDHTRAHAAEAAFMPLKSAGWVPPTPTQDQESTAGHCGKTLGKVAFLHVFWVPVSAMEMTSPPARGVPGLWPSLGGIYYYYGH
jgi:hypothetical protein